MVDKRNTNRSAYLFDSASTIETDCALQLRRISAEEFKDRQLESRKTRSSPNDAIGVVAVDNFGPLTFL